MYDQDIILADIPGILEGASEGLGMGFKFLRHISRTKGLAYLVDLSDENYLTAFDKLYAELNEYSEDLVKKPYVIIGTKIDEEANHVRGEEIEISTEDSALKLLVLPTDEELMIAKDTYDIAVK